MSVSEDLSRLSDLHASGALSLQEFNRAKEQLLGGTSPNSPAPHYAAFGSAPAAPQYPAQAPYPAPPAADWNGAGYAQTQYGQPQYGRPAYSDPGLHPHYRAKFANIDAQGGSFVSSWNWPAFLFGAFWYLARGMWAKALLFFVVVIGSAGFLALPLYIYAGIAGTYDYYLLKRKGKQLW